MSKLFSWINASAAATDESSNAYETTVKTPANGEDTKKEVCLY